MKLIRPDTPSPSTRCELPCSRTEMRVSHLRLSFMNSPGPAYVPDSTRAGLAGAQATREARAFPKGPIRVADADGNGCRAVATAEPSEAAPGSQE
jgi:hypothetical protein